MNAICEPSEPMGGDLEYSESVTNVEACLYHCSHRTLHFNSE